MRAQVSQYGFELSCSRSQSGAGRLHSRPNHRQSFPRILSSRSAHPRSGSIKHWLCSLSIRDAITLWLPLSDVVIGSCLSDLILIFNVFCLYIEYQ